MKICGYCGNEYDDREPKCPQCGSTLLKHTKGAESAAEEHERLKEEMKRKRKTRSIVLGVGAAIIVLVAVSIISNIVGLINDPQRAIAKESKELLSQAEQQMDDGEYDEALDILDQIDASWDEYEKVDDVRLEAVKGQLKAKLTEYEAAGNYQAIISMINENVADINADTEVKTAYESAVQNYKAEAISSAEEYAAAGDYTSARSVLTVAQNFIGDAVDISEKLKEINQKEVLEVVLSYESDGNYKDAIVYLNENSDVVSGSADLQTKLSTYTEKYRAKVISEAASEYEANGYEAAVSVLNSALKVLPNDSSLASEKVKYEDLAPVSLLDLDTFYSDYGDDSVWSNKRTVQVMEDKLGNYYENCIEYQYGEKDARDIYVINGEYTIFSGTIFVPDHRKSGNDDWSYQDPFYFYIYGDGKLLWRSPKMLSTQYPVDFEVDISGVKELSICWHGGASTWYYELGLANAWLYKD